MIIFEPTEEFYQQLDKIAKDSQDIINKMEQAEMVKLEHVKRPFNI